MSQAQAKILQEKAEMFEQRAESATDPISRQHYKEMAALIGHWPPNIWTSGTATNPAH